MSLSVDDLIASLSSNHIGQEAIDIATLQAQLTQAFFHNHVQTQAIPAISPQMHHISAAPRRDPAVAQHCTTPTTRTPSGSISLSSNPFQNTDSYSHRRNGSARSRSRSVHHDERWCDLEEMEEENMVEDILMPSSPQSPVLANRTFAPTQSPMVSSPTSPTYSLPSQAESLFPTTDPFYIAQLQAAQAPPPSSFLGQAGYPSAHSPFAMAGNGHHAVPMQAGPFQR